MKSYLLIFYVMLTPLFLRAQEKASSNATKIDSIQKLLDAKRQVDTTQVVRLNNLARLCFYDAQFTKGLTATRQARKLAEEIGFSQGEGLYLRTIAIFHRYTDLRIYYDTRAKWLYDDLGLRETEPIGSFTETINEVDEIFPHLMVALRHFQKEKDSEIAANLAYVIGAYKYQFSDTSSADDYLNSCYKFFVEAGMKTPAAFVHVFQLVMPAQPGVKNGQDKPREIQNSIESLEDAKSRALVGYYVGLLYANQGRRMQSIEHNLRANNEMEAVGETYLRILVLDDLGVSFGFLSLSGKAVDFYKKALQLRKDANYHTDEARTTFNLAFELVGMKHFEEARKYFERARALSEKNEFQGASGAGLFRYTDGLGQILMGQGKYEEALAKFQQAQRYDEQFFGTRGGNMYINFYLAQCYQKLGRYAESIRFAQKSYQPALNSGDQRLLIKVSLLLSEVYDASGQPLQALKFLKEYRSIVREKEEQNVANRAADLEIEGIIQKNEQEKAILEQEKLRKEAENQNQRWWIFSIAAALLTVITLTLLLYRNNRNKQKANVQLQQQKDEIERQREKAETALTNLKSAQTQLIQAEKMASLGELTAGIAHEIQNPLNFVNNYAEVNVELLGELKEEGEKQEGEKDYKLINELVGDVGENERKILHHGRQAEAIVKGMQQHSHRSSGTRESTDLNALTREYVELAYNGMTNKDKLSKEILQLNLDPTLPKLEVIPGDLGRVILNLLNNAFHAVSEKTDVPQPDYKPAVEVTTRKTESGVEIRIKDNGIGIPEANLPKLFQPFFTTRPTGQGTGLGLSLAYDIITKGHGGRLDVKSVEGNGSEFTVFLPY